MKTAKKTKGKKFKAIEKNAPDFISKDIPWEGEELIAESATKIEHDTGSGQVVVLKFFDFGANPETFSIHQPTAQMLFNTHIKGIETHLWTHDLKMYTEVEPRIMFSVDGRNFEPYSPVGKQYTHYRFIIPCVPKGTLAYEKTKTLSQLLTNAPS